MESVAGSRSGAPLASSRTAPSEVQPSVELSVVVPMRDEALNIPHFFERLMPVLERLGITYEIICVDDGSRDRTLELLLEMRKDKPAIKVLSLSRNFGKDIALTAGIEHAAGAALVPIDCDLQDPPELIEELLKKWREGYDVVLATRRARLGESWMKKATAKLFYRTFGKIADMPIPQDTGDFRLIDRRVAAALTTLPERSRFMKGLFAWLGFRQATIFYEREPRHAGSSNWNYWKLWNFALDGMTSFSSFPLKVWSYVGLGISMLTFLYASLLIFLRLTKGIDVPGYASLMVTVLFLGGIQLITLGIIGEYLARVYIEVKGRPLYIVRQRFGFEA
ncbi:MAG: glycosyltransferase family 2 protein [Candidatus Binataceae bacterium]